MPINPLVVLLLVAVGYLALILLVALIGDLADRYKQEQRKQWAHLHDVARAEIERVMTEEIERDA
jgi:hypothetical protein